MNSSSEDAENHSFTLFHKDPDLKKTHKLFSANSLEELVQLVNKGNEGMDPELPMVDEDRVFESTDDLLQFCSNSDFFIKGPDGEVVSGHTIKPGDWDEDAESTKEPTGQIYKKLKELKAVLDPILKKQGKLHGPVPYLYTTTARHLQELFDIWGVK